MTLHLQFYRSLFSTRQYFVNQLILYEYFFLSFQQPPSILIMPSLEGVVPAGVVTGANLMKLLNYCRDNEMALPAFNCTSSSTINAVLQAARDAKSAVMIQVSHG